MTGHGPSPETRFPLPGVQRLGFLKRFITRPTILVGDYTYYDDPDGPERFEEHVLYHFDFVGDRLIIGRYFEPAVVERLLAVAWWNWDAAKVTRNVRAICGADVTALEAAE